jgi:hypothetical protein
VSPRFPSSVIDQMLTRGQITRVAPNRAQSDQLLKQAEAHLRSARMLRDTDTAGAFVLAYDAARKALTAVLAQQPLTSTRRSRWRPPFINVQGASWTTCTHTDGDRSAHALAHRR